MVLFKLGNSGRADVSSIALTKEEACEGGRSSLRRICVAPPLWVAAPIHDTPLALELTIKEKDQLPDLILLRHAILNGFAGVQHSTVVAATECISDLV